MPMLMGDERRLKQILMNLVKNAIKFTSNGSINICVNYTNAQIGKLEIHVRDTGSGFA